MFWSGPHEGSNDTGGGTVQNSGEQTTKANLSVMETCAAGGGATVIQPKPKSEL